MATYFDYEEEDLGDMEENLTEEELLEDGDPEVEDDPPLEDESEEAGQLQPTTQAKAIVELPRRLRLRAPVHSASLVETFQQVQQKLLPNRANFNVAFASTLLMAKDLAEAANDLCRKDKFDETRMANVGGAMKSFFQLTFETKDKGWTMRDVVDYIDKSASLLLRTNGEYDWKKMKQAVELLYPTVHVPSPSRTSTTSSGGKAQHGRGRTAHEVQQWSDWSMPDSSDPQLLEWMEYYDPVEAIAENFTSDSNDYAMAIPEPRARELHSCFSSHRENRQKLAQAVQARGYYVNGKGGKGKSGGKGKKGAPKGKGRGGGGSKGKARGMTLEELKKTTTCAACGQKGHWKGDGECRQSNITAHNDFDEEQEGDEWYGEWTEWDPAQWGWAEEETRVANVSNRSHSKSRQLRSRGSVDDEAFEAARNVSQIRSKVQKTGRSSSSSKVTSGDFFVTGLEYVKNVLEASKEHESFVSAGPEAVRAAREVVRPGQDFEQVGSVWQLLASKPDQEVDVDRLRVRQGYMVRKVELEIADADSDIELLPDHNLPRLTCSMQRRRATVDPSRSYLTIDTACENTVCGSSYLQFLTDKLKVDGLKPLVEPEFEQYCFGPGKPQVSQMRCSLPIGIAGYAAVIRTSVIHEEQLQGGKGPNLAGQDWLRMMQVPIEIDGSGHLVIAIDDYPKGGWPPGLTTILDEYPGGVFTATRQTGDDAIDPVQTDGKKSMCAVAASTSLNFIPNFIYEPNHDNMNNCFLKGPCSVHSDYWEYDVQRGVVLRYHRRPRDHLFHPLEVGDGPDPKSLQGRLFRFLKGNSVQDIDIFKMHRAWVTSNLAIRELKHRAPALMGYAEAMVESEIAELQVQNLPATLPPSTTAARGQTHRVIQKSYPVDPKRRQGESSNPRSTGRMNSGYSSKNPRDTVDLTGTDSETWETVGMDAESDNEKMDRWNPRLAIVEYPCTPWSILQRNVNFRDNPEALRRLQQADKPFLRLTKDIFDSQTRRGAHALSENPATADSQREPEIVELRNKHFETTSCMCRFGMVGRKGVHYIDVDKDVTKWREPMDMSAEILARKAQEDLFIDPNTELYKKVSALVPWQIANIQISHLPKAKRIRPGLEKCHRCSVLLQHDETIIIETEHLPDAQAPRERFVTPVRYAIFILAMLLVTPKNRPQHSLYLFNLFPMMEKLWWTTCRVMEDQRLARQDYGAGECWFQGPPLRTEQKKLAPSIVRLHRNLGHPRQEDMVRALVQHGQMDPECITLAKRLKCATCERTRRPLPPRPTSLRATGSFNDKLCLDYIFIHDSQGEKHNYLHILKPNGGYNLFIHMPSRSPDDVWRVFQDAWASWAGFPRRVWIDQDGAFEGVFHESISKFSQVDTSAAEAHWQTGEIEAFNRAFRYAAERIIDERQLAGPEDMKNLGIITSAPMNDKIRACGASANQQLIRAQADMRISQYRVDHALRTAIHRKGRPGRLTYEPGELVAYWRNVKKKKGKILQPGWFRGTIVGPHRGTEEGGQNNYWVTSNGKLILVSKEQLRPTYGTERWRIDEPELQEFLDKDHDTFEDQIGHGPPDDAFIEDVNETEMVVPYNDDLEYTPSVHPGAEAEQDVPPPEPGEEAVPASSAAPSLGTDMSEHSAKRLKVGDQDEGQPHGFEVDPQLFDEAPRAALLTSRFVPEQEHEKFAIVPFLVLLTRKQQKALEKELPWTMIPVDERPMYHDALVKEWGTWCKYQAVMVLDLVASAYVLANVDPKRILDTRVLYKNKNAAYNWMPVKPKARIVCRGDRDPDLLTLRRDAPTLTRLGLMLICQLATSMDGWFMMNCDITGAFLQGDQGLAARKEPLFLKQPREGLPGLHPQQILLVVRGIFGLANSPRLFWRHLRDTLLQMGFRQSSLDKALFLYYKDHKLILAIGARVDDLIGTGEPGSADEILKLRETFDFGAWADDRTDKVLEYGGKQITRTANGEVKLTQEKFIQATSITPIPKWRTATPNAELSGTELTELRSAGGCLHWLVGQTRPDLAAGTSPYMSGTPTVDSLMNLNKLLKEAKSSETWGLTFKKIDLDKARILTFTDSSWANTMAMDAGVDSGIFCRELLAEMLVEDYEPTTSGRLPPSFMPMHAVTDCRSLFDLLVKDGPPATTQEKRLVIDINGPKEAALEFDPAGEHLKDTFRWVAFPRRRMASHPEDRKP
ncbi:unnamed protein product [Durusdinium trenchii]|uniref:Reverse transcriptase Ty1/copia-type domain-containing protein n=1 Tax=Durusdinium trenchii TaxID=1381693 RepID=A0ABP0ICZ8_9DINO